MKDERRGFHLGQADAEPVAVEVGVLPGLAQLSWVGGCGLSRDSAGRWRGGVLLVAQVLVLEDIIGVLSLRVSGTRSNDGSVEAGTLPSSPAL